MAELGKMWRRSDGLFTYSLCSGFDPSSQVLSTLVVVPEVVLVSGRTQRAAVRGISLHIGDFADVNRQQAITTSNAFLNLIFDPFTPICVRADKNYRDGRAAQLIINPRLNGFIPLPFNLFKLDRTSVV